MAVFYRKLVWLSTFRRMKIRLENLKISFEKFENEVMDMSHQGQDSLTEFGSQFFSIFLWSNTHFFRLGVDGESCVKRIICEAEAFVKNTNTSIMSRIIHSLFRWDKLGETYFDLQTITNFLVITLEEKAVFQGKDLIAFFPLLRKF